jgi:outer membrane receptor protein involved in Fe transport
LALCLVVTLASAGAQSASFGSIAGTAVDDTGAAVAAAAVTISGPVARSTKTDARGAFTFSDLPPGGYHITIAKGGYQTAIASQTVHAGETAVLAIGIHLATLTTLRTIGSVRSTAESVFNTSTASVAIVPQQTFAEQGATQVTPVLNEIPGVQISYPGSSANGAAPGAITFPNIRDGLSYETATLIDGHPLSVGLYGDYVTTFLNPYLLQSAEVIKGPGAMAPQVNYAINGTVNFRTKDPTPYPDTFYTVGATSRNGGVYALGVSDTILDDRLGFVFGVAGLSDPSALHYAPVYFDPGSGSLFVKGVNLYPYGCSSLNTLFGTSPTQFYSRAYNTCGFVGTTTVSGDYNNMSELFKVRYRIGQGTFFTASYFGSQSSANQSGNTAFVTPSIFTPGAGYHGSLQPGTGIDVLTEPYDAQPQFETNNEPIFQAEMSSAIGNDTVIARYYHAAIDRVQTTGNPAPFQPYTQFTNIYGTEPLSSSRTLLFNGETQTAQVLDYFNDPEEDDITGYSFEYLHPFSLNNEFAFAVDTTHSTSVDYYQDVGYAGSQCQLGDFEGYCFNTETNVPSGAAQNFTTWHIRDRDQITPRLAATVALYENTYNSVYPTNCANSTVYVSSTGYQTTCLPSGILDTWKIATPYTFSSSAPVNYASGTTGHFDDRLGLEWRPQPNIAGRFSAGSSIAPPFLDLLSEANQIIPPEHSGPGEYATQTINSGTLRPETAFGYDLGADYAFRDQVTYASTDFYLTNLYNQFLTDTYLNGTCPISICGVAGVPLYASKNINLSNARYEGIELTVKRVPAVGWGYSLAGSTQRGYAYDLPPSFYCGAPGCIPGVPKTYNNNLGIIAGENYIGEYVNNTGSTTYGVSNQAVPYLQGNAEISYRFRNGAFALFGETFYGKNNSLNEPPFWVGYLSLNYPINRDLAFQVSGYNIFNTYPQIFPIFGGGVTIPLSNGQSAGTIGNVLGPARYLFLLTKAFGPAPGVTPPPANLTQTQRPP